MSDGTLNFPKRSSSPSPPSSDRYKIYVDSSDDEVKYIDDLGVIRTFKGDQGDQGIQGIQGLQGIQGIPGPTGPMNVEALISETGTVTLPNTTNPTISATGDCFVDVSLAIKPHAANNDYEFQVQFNGNFVLPALVEEGKDQSNQQSNWRMQTLDLGNVSAGTYTLALFFSKEATGGSAQLKNYTAKVVRYS